MRDDPLAGLAMIDTILARGDPADDHLAHAVRAELCRRPGRPTRLPLPTGRRSPWLNRIWNADSSRDGFAIWTGTGANKIPTGCRSDAFAFD
jgi:hypothetical protein